MRTIRPVTWAASGAAVRQTAMAAITSLPRRIMLVRSHDHRRWSSGLFAARAHHLAAAGAPFGVFPHGLRQVDALDVGQRYQPGQHIGELALFFLAAALADG